MDMTNSVLLAAPQARVWEGLNDPEVLKRSIAGCESIERTGDNAYKVAMTVAIGPVKAKFKGDLMLEDIEAPSAYTIRFSGQGGVAGFGKGRARVKLSPEDAGTRLDYTVDAQVGGKIAQVGSRLIDGASKKMADDFFKAFRREIEPAGGVVAAEPAPATQAAQSVGAAQPGPAAQTAEPAPVAHAGQVAHGARMADATPGDSADWPPAQPGEGVPTASAAVDRLIIQGLSNERWTWLAIAVALASTVLLMKR